MRSSKTISGTPTYVVYDEASGTSFPLLEEDQDGDVTNAYGIGADGVRERYLPGEAGNFYYEYQYDPMGNYVQRYDSSVPDSPVLDTAEYSAYGVQLGDYFTNDGTQAGPGAAYSTGYGAQNGNYTDYETGLICLGHRYYDPGTGRFINRDPIGYEGGENLYAYCGNNPLNEVDPDGTKGIVIFVHGTMASSAFNQWSSAEVNAVVGTFNADHIDFYDWTNGGMAGSNYDQLIANDSPGLAKMIAADRTKWPNEPVALVTYSNGGTVAYGAIHEGSDVSGDALPNMIVSLGKPSREDENDPTPSSITWFDFQDIGDTVAFKFPLAALAGYTGKQPLDSDTIKRKIISCSGPWWNFWTPRGIQIHENLPRPDVWRQVAPYITGSAAFNQFR